MNGRTGFNRKNRITKIIKNSTRQESWRTMTAYIPRNTTHKKEKWKDIDYFDIKNLLFSVAIFIKLKHIV